MLINYAARVSINKPARQQLATKPKDAADEKRLAAEMAAVTGELFDVRDLASRALVDHWKKLSMGQQDTIVGLLQQIVERSHLKLVRENQQFKWDYVGEDVVGDMVVVRSVIHSVRKKRAALISVNYALRATGDRWRAVDLVTDGVSLVKNYRAEFNRIIRKQGVDGLIARMKRKLATP